MRRRTAVIEESVGCHGNLEIFVVGDRERLQVRRLSVRGPAIVCRDRETAEVTVFDNLSDRRFWCQILAPPTDEWADTEEG